MDRPCGGSFFACGAAGSAGNPFSHVRQRTLRGLIFRMCGSGPRYRVRQTAEAGVKVKKTIRMIGVDLDGTLLTKQKELTGACRAALEAAIRAGVEVVPVTGRPFAGVPAEVTGIPGIRYLITSNGANTYDLAEKKVVRKKHMPHALTRAVLNEVTGPDVIREIFIRGVGYHDERTQRMLEDRFCVAPPILAYINRSRRIVRDFEGLLADESAHVENISLMFPSGEARDQVYNRLKKLTDEDGVPLVQILLPWKTDLEITHIMADKWIALKGVADRLGIPAEEIMALGDGDNDRPMLRGAGYSVAMGNAPDFVKETADICTTDNDHDGAAAAILEALSWQEPDSGESMEALSWQGPDPGE